MIVPMCNWISLVVERGTHEKKVSGAAMQHSFNYSLR